MDKKFVVLMIFFFITFGILIASTLFNKQFSKFARASAETEPSANSSLIFAWPITTQVGNKVDVNIFVRNANNQPLEKKPVKLVTTLGSINGAPQFSLESDKTGKVNFTLTSKTAGIAQLTAYLNGNIRMKQKFTVKFE